MALTARRLASKTLRKAGGVVGRIAGKKPKQKNTPLDKARRLADFALRQLERFLRLVVFLLRNLTALFAVLAFFLMMFLLLALLIVAGGVAGFVLMAGGNLGGSGGRRVVSSGSKDIGVSGSGLATDAIQTLGNWMITDLPIYDQTKKYPCPILDSVYGEDKGSLRPDCTGFAQAVVAYMYNDPNVPISYSGDMVRLDGEFATYVKSKGYCEVRDIVTENVKVGDLSPGDMLIYRGSSTGHAEFYMGPSLQFGWGAVQSKFPIENGMWTKQASGAITNNSWGEGHTYTTWYHFLKPGSSSSSSSSTEVGDEE